MHHKQASHQKILCFNQVLLHLCSYFLLSTRLTPRQKGMDTLGWFHSISMARLKVQFIPFLLDSLQELFSTKYLFKSWWPLNVLVSDPLLKPYLHCRSPMYTKQSSVTEYYLVLCVGIYNCAKYYWGVNGMVEFSNSFTHCTRQRRIKFLSSDY